MSLAMRRVKVYSKLALVVLVVIAICAVLWKNRSHRVEVWFFWLVDEGTAVNVVWLIAYTALGALLSYWVLSKVWGLRRDLKQVAADAAVRQKDLEQQDRARELKEQEERIDAKLRKAVSEE